MYYSFKNLPVKLNSVEVLANSIDMSVQDSMEPTFLINQKFENEWKANNGLNGNCKLSYYLNANDPLRDFFFNETRKISGYVGGLYFTGAYLNNYSIECVPNNPVTVNSNIVFFDQIYGSILPQTPIQTDLEVLNFSDVVVHNVTGYSSEVLNNITRLSYTFSSDITPFYYVTTGSGLTNIQPGKVKHGLKQVVTEITCDSLSGNLNLAGQDVGVKIIFTHPTVQGISDYLLTSGRLTQKSITSSTEDFVKGNLSIIQHRSDKIPAFSFSPAQAYPGQNITIVGENLDLIEEIFIGNTPIRTFTLVND